MRFDHSTLVTFTLSALAESGIPLTGSYIWTLGSQLGVLFRDVRTLGGGIQLEEVEPISCLVLWIVVC